ncbi:hypothetical protein KKE99_01820, partial [Patescibacteria group bacterium]|nr:hypothetical protein [Patescibacteria group bacterium]
EKLKQHYGENSNTLLNESFIRTYVNFFEKGSGPYNYEYLKEYLKKRTPEANKKEFQDSLRYDKEFKQRMDVMGISNFKEFSEISKEYFEKYEKDILGNIIYGFYEDYRKELQNNEKLIFEDFVLEKFAGYIS